jgi:hypothetical protein
MNSSEDNSLKEVSMIPKYLDSLSLLVIAATFSLFILALFLKGFGQSLLLEAGVFLVSAKLIVMARKLELSETRLLGKVQALQDTLDQVRQQLSFATEPEGETLAGKNGF